MPKLIINRREFAVGGAALITAMSSLPVFASGKLKVAGIYTVPTQQKWVARLHLALDAAAKRGEIEYVYSETFGGAFSFNLILLNLLLVNFLIFHSLAR